MDNNNEDQVIDEEIVDNHEEEIIVNANDSETEESTEEPVISQESDEEDRVVTIGEPETVSEETEEEKPETPGWIKTVRKSNRNLTSENKKLKRQLEELTKPKEEVIDLGEKPTLSKCEYDDKKYETELIGYYERKRKVEEQQAQKAHVVEDQKKQWQGKQERYAQLRKEHSFKDFQDAEEVVIDTFNQTQQGIIVQGAEDSALLVYALGKNPAKLEELSKITDPVDFAFKVAKLESQLKVTGRKAPRPEKRITGGKAGGVSGNGDSTLDRLREDAAKTGDYSAVTAYKRKLKK